MLVIFTECRADTRENSRVVDKCELAACIVSFLAVSLVLTYTVCGNREWTELRLESEGGRFRGRQTCACYVGQTFDGVRAGVITAVAYMGQQPLSLLPPMYVAPSG